MHNKNNSSEVKMKASFTMYEKVKLLFTCLLHMYEKRPVNHVEGGCRFQSCVLVVRQFFLFPLNKFNFV